MRYRRALLLTELEGDARPALAALKAVAPELEHLAVVARLPAPTFAWLSGGGSPESNDGVLASLDILREAAARAAPSSQVELAPELNIDALVELAKAGHVALLVAGSRSLKSASMLAEIRKRVALAVLWVEGDPSAAPVREVCCVALGQRDRPSIGAFLRDHADSSVHVTLLSPAAPAPDELTAMLEVAGVVASVEVPSLGQLSMRGWLDAWAPERAVDLFVFARLPTPLLLGAPWPAPVLLLPPRSGSRPLWQRAIDVADLADDGGPLRVRVDYAAAMGDLSPVPDQPIAFVSGGRVVATAHTRAGAAELPAGLGPSSLGVFRAGDQAPEDTLAAIEQRVTIVRATERALLLFDAELSDETLTELATLTGPELLAVRLRPSRSCRTIRERLRSFELSPRVLDARAVLDEGEALDVSEALDAVRLARVAHKLQSAGFPIAAIVHRGPSQPLVQGFTAWSALELASGGLEAAAHLVGSPPADVVASGTCASTELLAGNRIELELDNARARRFLLEAIASSTDTVHLQVYMAADDAVGSEVESALAQAGARGVTVRVLVDSLHGWHGSFGIQNPLLARLSARPGVALRTSRPITEPPSIAELKQRDHRKLVVIDGRLALLGGRNLSYEYYTGFAEAELGLHSTWREVPWLDAGARVEGPAVGALARSFLEAWTEAGGDAFELTTPAPIGTHAARVVVHRGLRDARTLEAYRSLIDSAESHIYVVNGFPLMLELQHALLRALGRGVAVRVLIGHLTPTHGGQPFKGPWAPARIAATELVHSRVDALTEAGGEIYHFALRDVAGWDTRLGVVHPHVHAKLMSADGLRCTVGSANLDITSAYWESELLLVVEDGSLARAFESEIETLFTASVRVQREDPAWQQLARRRAWMRHWPGVLSF